MNQIKNLLITIKQLLQQACKPLPFPYGGKITIKEIITCFITIIVIFILSIAAGVIVDIALNYYRHY